jgi:hypothetical protein
MGPELRMMLPRELIRHYLDLGDRRMRSDFFRAPHLSISVALVAIAPAGRAAR